MEKQGIIEVYENMMANGPDVLAVTDGNRRLSRRELWEMSELIAARLPQGAGRIGIIMDHSVEMIAAIFAVLKTGAAYVPAEPSFPPERIRYMLADGQARAVITQARYAPLAGDIPTILVEPGEKIMAEAPVTRHRGKGENLAYILYTSGTTGKPKGVAVTHGNVLHYVRAFRHEFSPGAGDVMLQYSVCSFDIFVEEVFASLLSGAALAIPAAGDKKDIGRLMDFVRRHRVTIISGFPYLLQELNELPELPESLRLLISGGDVLRAAYVDKLVAKVAVYNTYGPSETTVCAAYYNCSEGQPLADGTYPVGTAVFGTEITVRDKAGRSVPAGTVGEICIAGGGVSLGYTGNRAKENEAFKMQADGSRIYYSGDLGYVMPDGNIAFLHRKDTQIMILGKRVEVSEVENVLLQSDMVHQACVRPLVDERQLSYMVAYIVKKDEGIRLSAIRQYLSRYLTDFMIPELFVEMPKLPLNANGKVDKQALPIVERKISAA